MSADFRTEHFKGYSHGTGDGAYIHVVAVAPPDKHGWGGGESTLGGFTLGEIGELAEMAGQAWPEAAGVEVRYVIECRLDGGMVAKEWTPVWSALASQVDEEFAAITYSGMLGGSVMEAMKWRLVRRTTVTRDEVLQPEPADG